MQLDLSKNLNVNAPFIIFFSRDIYETFMKIVEFTKSSTYYVLFPTKGQIKSEWIYEIINFSKYQLKN